MSGGQFGLQMDVSLMPGIRLSPFFMMSSFSGTATLTNDPGNSRARSTTISENIPSSTSTAFGLDIFINSLSIGTVLQQLSSQQQGNDNLSIFMISIGYHFSNGEELKNSN